MQRLITILLALVACACSMPFDRQFPPRNSSNTEGDIVLHPSQVGKNGVTDSKFYWPNAQVYYVIEPIYTAVERNIILEAISHYNTRTCVRFVERTNQQNYVVIGNQNGDCSSEIGMTGRGQWLNLAPTCLINGPGIAIHEFLHTLGFWHQHAAPSRDKWVKIEWNNILPGMHGQFKKYDSPLATEFGVEYDYGSIMHYGAYDFSSHPSLPTITTIVPNVHIGQRVGLSQKDILKLHRMYKCQ